MKILNKLFPSKEIKMIITAINNVEEEFGEYLSFEIVRKIVLDRVYRFPKETIDILQYDNDPLKWTYLAIANVSGDYVQSGEFHVYRGVLNHIGKDLLKLHFAAIEKLVEIGNIDEVTAREVKRDVRKNIRNVG